MKINLPVTNKTVPLESQTRIVSTTNLGGQITYANEDFCKISGFTPEELEMQAHNIIRHPDMPQAAFKMIWDKLKAGGSWMGLVKNRCKNGDHYWVDAFITPILENGKVTGYQSVRMRAEQEHIDNAEKLYKKLARGKSLGGFGLSLQGKIFVAITASIAACLLPGFFMDEGIYRTLVGAALGLGAGGIAAAVVANPWKIAADKARQTIDDPVAMKIYTNRSDELGQLLLVQHQLSSKLQTVIWRLSDSAIKLETVSENTAKIAAKTASDMNKQGAEVEQVASAVAEMSATVNEVAHNAAEAAGATENARSQVVQGKTVVQHGIDTTRQLAEQVDEAAAVIASLADVTNAIGGAAAMIRSIAEQTNLLALNAAIEAARAGEQGRGFAVVADEVRSLASKTQTSTNEIQGMIQALQNATEKAVKVMHKGTDLANNNVDQSALIGNAFDNIDHAVTHLSDMVMHIATAAEEQSSVAEEINRNICNINDLSDQTQRSTGDSYQSINALTKQIHHLQSIASQFIR